MHMQSNHKYIMAVMTFVMTAILVACSDGSYLDESINGINNDHLYSSNKYKGVYSLRWISDKKTIGNTYAVVSESTNSYELRLAEMTLPWDFVLSKVLHGNDLQQATSYISTQPQTIELTFSWIGMTDKSSTFFQISPFSTKNTITFVTSYQNTNHECTLYLDANGSALTIDDTQINLLGVLKVDSIAITDGVNTLTEKSKLSLTFVGERQ